MMTEEHRQVILRVIDLRLPSSVIRDFSGLLPFLYNEQWHTSITLRNKMRWDISYTRKELSRISSALCNIYNNSKLLKRQEKRRIYNRYQHTRHISHWAYQLDWEYLSQIMPNPEVEEYNRLKAERNFQRSIE